MSAATKDGSSLRDVVVELRQPRVDRLTFDVRVLEGDLTGADGPAAWYGAAAAAYPPPYPYAYPYPPPYYPRY